MSDALQAAREAVAETSRAAYRQGWMPATSGNISVRTAPTRAVISASGCPKGELTDADTVEVDIATAAACDAAAPRPSAETVIHTALYRLTSGGAVIHTHGPHATAISIRHGDAGEIRLTGFELIKGVAATRTDSGRLLILPNHSDVARIATDIDTVDLDDPATLPAVLVAGHGLTVWADSLAQAWTRAEGVEELCRLALLAGSTRGGPAHTTTANTEGAPR